MEKRQQTVDLLLTEIQGSDKPLLYHKAEGGTVELTASNYQQELEGEPVYRYTFQKQGEQLILSGIRQVGVLAEGAAGGMTRHCRWRSRGPQLQTPERGDDFLGGYAAPAGLAEGI